MTVTLRARWVLPVDRPAIAGGFVSMADGRISAVSAADPCVGAVDDLGDVVLLPGLVNAHTHLEFSGLREPLGSPGMALPAWIRLVIGDRKRGDRDAATAIAEGIRESVASGVTAIGEIATSPARLYQLSSTSPTSVLFQEAIGFSAGRVDSVLGESERRLDEAPQPAGVSPHAPYTVHPQLLAKLVEAARSRQLPIAMHLAESPEELELLATGGGPFRELLEERSMWDGDAIPAGSRPLDYLHQLALASRSLVIHGNYLTPDEIEFIAQRQDRMSVVYCPRTHAYFGHRPYPLDLLQAARVRVALGTDSRASNPDLNLLNEARCVVESHGVAPADALRMATLNGAEALGLGDEVGSLAVSKRADLVAVPVDATYGDPFEAVLAGNHLPSGVWIGGKRI
jgi:aminodeoxyfutalosine deaminase